MRGSENKKDINKLQQGKTPHGIKNPVRQRLFSLKEAALYLGRGTDSMRELVYQGVFPVVQEGERSKIWIDRYDLDAWIEGKKHSLREES